jgi:hypothetical protein
MADAPQQDDPTIPDETILWRRIPPLHRVRDETRGGRQVSSAAFDDNKQSPMSVVIARPGRDPNIVLAGFADFALAGLLAGDARACGQVLQRVPEPDEPDHAHVVGPKKKRDRQRLRDRAFWVVQPAGWKDVHLP